MLLHTFKFYFNIKCGITEEIYTFKIKRMPEIANKKTDYSGIISL